MKRKLIVWSIAATISGNLVFFAGCKKGLESVVDCFAETSLLSINSNVDSANSKVYTFNANYGGTHTLGDVKWNFGDGTEATTSGTASTTHTFKTGSYVVKAVPTVSHESETCMPTLQKTIVVN